MLCRGLIFNSFKMLSSGTQTSSQALSLLVQNEQTKALIEQGKKASAYLAIDQNIDKNTKIVGIGSGSTIVYAVERLAERIKNENLDIICIPSSFQSKQLLIKHNLKTSDLETYTKIDLTVDGADEVDKELVCIKGGGACHLQEKLIAYCAKKFVVIADSRKKSSKLGQNWDRGIPIEVFPASYRIVQEKIENLYGGKANLRENNSTQKAGPVVTDNGNFILDWVFETKDSNSNVNYDWKTINISIKMIPGVIETGLFIGMAKIAYFGKADGTVEKVDEPKSE